MTPIPMQRPSAGREPGFWDDILDFGKGAADLFFDYQTRSAQADIAADMRQAEALKLRQIEAAGLAGNPSMSDTVSPAPAGFSVPQWVWPVLIAGGIGLIAIKAVQAK